jgi:hypothetical protein
MFATTPFKRLILRAVLRDVYPMVIRLVADPAHSAAAEKLAAGLSEFETYIRNNREFIPNFGERDRQGETISTAFVESSVNRVVSRRFVK